MTSKRRGTTVLVLAMLALVLGLPSRAVTAVKKPSKLVRGASPKARFEAGLPADAPRKLSDLYKFFTQSVADGLGTDLHASSVRITGQSWELLRDARFPEVELTLKPFEAQGLHFEKGGFLFRGLEVDQAALFSWKLKVKQLRQVQSRMVFTLRSLAQHLNGGGQDLHLQADMEAQQVVVTGRGSFCGIACQVVSPCRFVWDENAKTMRLVPVSAAFGGHALGHWLWGLGTSPVPKAPILDFGFSWIPFNIQEVHVGWDEVDLSTDW